VFVGRLEHLAPLNTGPRRTTNLQHHQTKSNSLTLIAQLLTPNINNTPKLKQTGGHFLIPNPNPTTHLNPPTPQHPNINNTPKPKPKQTQTPTHPYNPKTKTKQVGPAATEELQKLQDAVPPFPNEVAFQVK
jgi:hypothetical protein